MIGFTSSTDLPVVNSIQKIYGGGNADAFVVKLLPKSFTPLYATYLGGSGDEYGYGIYSEALGGVWVGGSTSSVNYPVKKGFQSTYAGGPFDAFLTRLTLTIPDYCAILKDLLSGDEAALGQLATVERDFAAGNAFAAAVELEQMETGISGTEAVTAVKAIEGEMRERP